MRALILVVVVGLFSGVAAAEKVRTNQSTKLFARPGEQAKVLMTLKSGQNMSVVEKEGRWLKVRVKGRTGYVPRSKVEMADDDGIARNTRRRPFVDGRGKKRGFGGSGGAPDDRVGADAVGDSSGGDEDEGDDEDEDDEPAPKKAAKPAAKPAAKKPASRDEDEDDDEEDDEDDEDETPAPRKTVAKATTKPAPTPAKKPAGGDDEDEDDEGGKASGGDDEDEDDEGGKASGGDDENPIEEAPAPKRQTARVTKKVAVYAEPGASAEDDEEFFVLPTDVLYPMETRDGWTEIENEEGDYGWVRSDDLELVTGGGGASGGKRVIDIRARMGLTYIQQAMRTAGSSVLTVPDNYNVRTPSLTLSLGGGVLFRKGKKLLFGGELAYDYSKTLIGGIGYDPDGDGTMPSTTIGVSLHNLNVRLVGGIDLNKKSGMAVLARLGYRYQGFLIANVESMTANPARLPSEVVTAPTLGAALAIPRLTEKIGLRFSLDSIVFGGGIKQTEGLEDGASPSVFALAIGASFTYKLKKSFDLIAGYDLNYMGINFGAPLASSMRGHMGTQVQRTDIFHAITFGVTRPF